MQKDLGSMVDLALVGDQGGGGRDRQALDLQRLRVVLGDGERHPRIAHDVGVFLAVAGNQAVDDQPVIAVADHRRLRPAVGPVGGDRHDTMLIEQIDDLPFEFAFHG